MSTTTITRPTSPSAATGTPCDAPVRAPRRSRPGRPTGPANRTTMDPVTGPAARPVSRPTTVPSRRPAARPAPMVRRTRREAPPVRLTRRGRVVLTLVMLAAVLATLALFSGQSAATGDAGYTGATTTVVVGDGDTLWGIASAVAAPGETREMVHEIEVLNSLPGPVLEVGQKLAVPAS